MHFIRRNLPFKQPQQRTDTVYFYSVSKKLVQDRSEKKLISQNIRS